MEKFANKNNDFVVDYFIKEGADPDIVECFKSKFYNYLPVPI